MTLLGQIKKALRRPEPRRLTGWYVDGHGDIKKRPKPADKQRTPTGNKSREVK